MDADKIVKVFQRGVWTWDEAATKLRELGLSEFKIIELLGEPTEGQ